MDVTERQTLRLTWGMEYSIRDAKAKLDNGMSDTKKMGAEWSVTYLVCGRPQATFIHDLRDKCDRMLCQLIQWKQTDPSAYSTLLSNGEPVDVGLPATNTKRKKGSNDTNSLLGWVITARKDSTLTSATQNKPSRKKHGKVNTGKPVKITEHFGVDYDERIERASSKKNGSMNLSETEALHKRRNKRIKPTKPPGYVLENVPVTEYQIKWEKIQDVTSYALRHGLYDLEIRKRNKHYDRWEQLVKTYRELGINTRYMGTREMGFILPTEHYVGPPLLHTGDGQFYNGYYIIEKRDWYTTNPEPVKLTKMDYRPDRIVKIYFGRDFPQWPDYWPWYWDDSPGSAPSGREILDHDPRELDSNGDTLSNWTWANSRWCKTPWDSPSISSSSCDNACSPMESDSSCTSSIEKNDRSECDRDDNSCTNRTNAFELEKCESSSGDRPEDDEIEEKTKSIHSSTSEWSSCNDTDVNDEGVEEKTKSIHSSTSEWSSGTDTDEENFVFKRSLRRRREVNRRVIDDDDSDSVSE